MVIVNNNNNDPADKYYKQKIMFLSDFFLYYKYVKINSI